MADTTIKKWNPTLNNNNGGWEEVYPETTVGQIQASGTRSSTTFLRGDGVWSVPSGVDNYVNTTGDTMTGNLINQGYIEVEDPNDSDYVRYRHYGVEFNRSASYLRPETNGTYTLNIGSNDQNKPWDTIKLDADNKTIIPIGNVGIGTTNPKTKLNVASGTSAAVTPTLGSAENSSAIFTNSVNAYGLNVMPSGSGDVHLQVQRFDASTSVYDLNLQPSGGNVGIGTTSPSQKLEVDGNINANELHLNDTNTKLLEANNNAVRIQTNSGYVDVGPKNTAWSHFETDRGRFYFNKGVDVDGDIRPYTNNTTKIQGSTGYIFELGERVATRAVFEPGNSGGSRRFIRLFTLDGVANSTGASADVILSGAGDYGDFDRTALRILAGERGNAVTVDVYQLNAEQTSDAPIIYWKTTGTNVFEIWAQLADYNQTHQLNILNKSGSVTINLDSITTTTPSSLNTVTNNTLWHSGNDGSGSGLDADTLDNQHGSYYAPKASPALTGTPTAPTAAANTNTTQIATTAYVQQEITDLIGGAPGALDTLNELAAAINDDASYASTITTALAGKVAKSGDTMTDTLTISAAKTTDDPLLKLVSTATGDGDAVIELEANDTGEAGIIFKNPDNTNAQGWFLGYGDAFSEHFYLYDRQNGGTKLVVGHDGDVGIGTTSPKGKLQIHQDTLDTAALFISRYNNEDYALFQVGEVDNFGGAGSYGGSVVNASNRTLVLSTQDLTGSTIASANRPDLAIISSGYVGIGTSSPTEKLTVYGDSNISENSPVTYIKHNFTGTHGFGLSVSRDNSDVAALALGSNSSNHGIVVANNTDLVLSTISSGAINSGMTVKTSGNVGIGTTSPSEKLQVDGNIKLNSTLPKIQFTDTNNDSDFHIANNNGVLEIADTTNQLERMKIDSSGNVTLPASGGLTLVDKALTNSSGALLWDGDEIYHEGHKPTYTELGTMAYSNLTGTPTIPTNNNQLTNGAGYTTNTGTVTSVATGGGLTGGTITGSGTISHADTSTQASVNNSGNTFIQDITLDTYGHITAITSATASSSGGNTWTEIKTGSTTISSGTTVTNVTLSSAIDDTSVIAFELNTASVTSYTSQVFIVKIENSSSTNGGILYNQYAASTLIRTGSLRVYRGINSTTLSFSNVYYYSNGSSAETADTVYVGKIWKLGVTGA